jgi:hypothetical protein
MVSSSLLEAKTVRGQLFTSLTSAPLYIYKGGSRRGTSHRPRPKKLVIEANMVFSFINPKRHKMESHVSVYF